MPVDVVSVVALSLTCFHGCVKGLVVLGKAKHFARDVSDVQFQTELMLHSLTVWAREAGLTKEPPLLLVGANDLNLVPKILGQLETLFSDIGGLDARYGIRLQATDEDVDVGNDNAESVLDVDTHQGNSTERIDVAVFRKRKQPWKRLRWITFDDKKFERLLDKANGYVRELVKFLEHARQERMEHNLEFVLRNVILHAEDDHRLGVIGKDNPTQVSNYAVSAAAKLKQARLKLGIMDTAREHETDLYQRPLPSLSVAPKQKHDTITSSGSNGPLTDMKLSMRLLTLDRAARAEPRRTLAMYDGQTVLLEWKYVTSLDHQAISRRVNQVAAFLQGFGPTLHSLRCRGIVRDPVAKRYGYIFDLPHHLESRPDPSQVSRQTSDMLRNATQFTPLRQMLDQSRQSNKPSLNTRLSFAITLLETLLTLHTAGWLHKELRSDNIYLIRAKGPVDDASKNDLSHVLGIRGRLRILTARRTGRDDGALEVGRGSGPVSSPVLVERCSSTISEKL